MCTGSRRAAKGKSFMMYTPQAGGKGTPFSPFGGGRSSKSATQGRRSVSLFTPQRKTPYSTRYGSSRKLQTSQVVEETAQHCVESYGTSLPVLVTETLTLADRSADISVKIEPSGWTWLVHGRRLFVWRFKGTSVGKSSQCKELTLPPSDLVHKADRVCIIPTGDQLAACIAVSAEGVVRFWQNIAHEGSFIETSADLKGEVTGVLIDMMPHGCLLASTTSTVMLLRPGHHSVSKVPLKSTEGMLAGFGRRMSSFIFGSVTAQALGAPLKKLLLGEEMGPSSLSFYLLSEAHLQKWMLSDPGQNKLLYQCEVEKLVTECLAETIWGQDATQLPQLQTWVLDIQLSKDGILLLSAGVNLDVSPQVHYALGKCIPQIHYALDKCIPQVHYALGKCIPQIHYALGKCIPQIHYIYQEDNEAELLSYKLLLPDPCGAVAFLHNTTSVYIVSVTSSSQAFDKVEFQGPGERFLGAGRCDNQGIFFSNNHGLISIQHTPGTAPVDTSAMDDSVAMDTYSRPESVMGTSDQVVAELSMSEDQQTRLKAAFLHLCRGNQAEAQSIVDDLFPPKTTRSLEPGSQLDAMVATLSRDLIDDFPASDPRWAEAMPQGKVSRIQEIVEVFLEHEEELLTSDTSPKEMVSVILAVNAIIEGMLHEAWQYRVSKVAVFQAPNPHIRDPEYLPWTASSGMKGVRNLVTKQHQLTVEHAVSESQDVQTRGALLQQLVNITDVLLDGYRCQLDSLRMLPGDTEHMLEVQQSYTQARHNLIMPFVKLEQYDRAAALAEKYLDFGILVKICEESNNQERLQRYMTQYGNQGFSDFVFKWYMEEGKRGKLLTQPLVHNAALGRFLQAENTKFLSWLHEINTGEFMQVLPLVFKINTGEFMQLLPLVYKIYTGEFMQVLPLVYKINTGEFMQLLPLVYKINTGEFMQVLPLVYKINTGEFMQAHKNLKELALDETEYLSKKKTLLSLSKLSALAADEPVDKIQDAMEDLNEELNLLLHQETLPQDIIEHLGLDPDNMQVFSPKQLIELYVSDVNEKANEFDFKKALDLLSYIDKDAPDVDSEALKLHIWCKAIGRDNWVDIQTDNPLENSRETIFFKTVELIYTEGSDVMDYLPDVESLLTADELSDLRNNNNFQYLVRAGYEHMQTAMT
ncbi:nuclear pore complex protein Nup133 [Lingula anatina]|uniref:Nuclear pore complex protein Nup133 n=1 Tax=Lingula anatina TaxID=7574 RepID=A0A1S3KFB7_LINAN|nr:nuclear pore complex protein Nup133 [Lingula anatina]|eukprot:XP_013421328.1 nuclear pore complex protein Nup133 [Lingula anatina]